MIPRGKQFFSYEIIYCVACNFFLHLLDYERNPIRDTI